MVKKWVRTLKSTVLNPTQAVQYHSGNCKQNHCKIRIQLIVTDKFYIVCITMAFDKNLTFHGGNGASLVEGEEHQEDQNA